MEVKAALLRRDWTPIVISAVAAVTGYFLATDDTNTSLHLLGIFLAWCGGVLGPIFAYRNGFRRARPTTVRVDGGTLTIDDYGNVLTEKIVEATVLRHRRDAVVELTVRDRPRITLRMTPADAHMLVAHIGSRRSRFRLMLPFAPRFLSVFGVLLLFSFANNRGWEPVLLAAPGLALLSALAAAFIGLVRGSLVVGADGFMTRWLWIQGFASFSDVARIGAPKQFGMRGLDDTIVELKSGRRIRLESVKSPNNDTERGAEGRALRSHLADAFERSTLPKDADLHLPSLLARGSRSAREWLSALDALANGARGQYRVAAISPEALAEVVANPTAAPEARVGAAAALVKLDDPAFTSRVRVAAEACADERLREMLIDLTVATNESDTEDVLERYS